MARKLSRSKLRLKIRPDKTAFKNGSADLLHKDALLFCLPGTHVREKKVPIADHE